ncbi:MAG: hypothetical protein KKA79_01200 [Nanoarchaeota archaeon]|nr:hypothetical protein [Nanoarchaeota archaeon]
MNRGLGKFGLKMKIPRSFRMKKNLDEHIRKLLEDRPKPDYDPLAVKAIIDNGRKFSEEDRNTIFFDQKYLVGTKLANEISYTKEDLRIASGNLELKYLDKYNEVVQNCMTYLQVAEYNLGLYLSALTNKILAKEEIIVLEPNFLYGCMGAYVEKGTLIIDFDVGNNAGFCMLGGNVIVRGNADDSAGCNMTDGELIIEGCLGNNTGTSMEGGIIRVSGNIKSIASNYKNGIIIQGEEFLRE